MPLMAIMFIVHSVVDKYVDGIVMMIQWKNMPNTLQHVHLLWAAMLATNHLEMILFLDQKGQDHMMSAV